MTRGLFAFLVAALTAFGAAAPHHARAGGFYFTDRGVRPLGRGFATVAGVDDGNALWYNPAALTVVPSQLFLDATLTFFDGTYTRVDSGGNRLPSVDATVTPPPIPMIAFVSDLGLHDDLDFGVGLYALNEVSLDWPETIRHEGAVEPAPQRYSLISLDGSALVNLTAAASYEIAPGFSVGVALTLVTGAFSSRVALSACDRVLCTQPENPEWDSISQLEVFPVLAPTGSLGVRYGKGGTVIAASVSLPYSLSATGSLEAELPNAAIFDGASIDGDEATIEADFPWVLRAGVEQRFGRNLRVEAAAVFEGWSTQDRIRIDGSEIVIRDAVGVGDYRVGVIDIPRQMNDVLSLRLGAEYELSSELSLRAGVNYQTSSFDVEYLTALTLDSDKLIVGLGASFAISPELIIDAAFGHVFLANRTVTNSRVPQATPIRPPPDPDSTNDGPAYVGNGHYAMEANMVGLGLRWLLDVEARAPVTARR